MEEEDVGGSERGHDPHQPAHVTRPGTQLPQVQPDEAQTGTNNYRHCIHTLSTDIYCIYSLLVCLPRGVGGSDEEIDHHPVTHVETVLHRPEERDQTAS